MHDQALPKTLWIYWHDGWRQSPAIVNKCVETWRVHNPNWNIFTLSKHDLEHYIHLSEIIPQIDRKNIQLEALSDIIRISLLHQYGGVWADSTLYCNQPLDTWLNPSIMPSGFFAFSKPGVDRMVSSWFLAAGKENYVIEQWYLKTIEYWRCRSERDEYFWFHYLFGKLYNADKKFKHLWDQATVLLAKDPHYFLPYADSFPKPLTAEVKQAIDHSPTPVFKLTHKYDESLMTNDSTLNYLLNRQLAGPKSI